jgi:HK97 family phage portal protein
MSSDVKYSNVEQQDLFFAKHTIAPWVVNIEQELRRKLLRPVERDNYEFKFSMLSLMRGDMAARANYYHTLLSDGVLSVNEVRSLEDRNAIENGELHLVQVNQIPLESMRDYAKSLTGQAPDGDVQ